MTQVPVARRWSVVGEDHCFFCLEKAGGFKNSYFCYFLLLTLEIGAFNELLFIVCHIMFLILANNTVLQTCLGFFCHTW